MHRSRTSLQLDRSVTHLRFGTGIVLRIAYGHDVFLEPDDTYDDIVRRNGYNMTHCGPVGGTPIDLFPIRASPRSFTTYYSPRRDDCQSAISLHGSLEPFMQTRPENFVPIHADFLITLSQRFSGRWQVEFNVACSQGSNLTWCSWKVLLDPLSSHTI